MSPRPPHDLVRAVQAELATPGRYHLQPPAAVRRSWIQLAFAWLTDRYRDLVHALAAHVHFSSTGVSLTGDLIVLLTMLAVAFVAARLLLAVQFDRASRAGAAPLAPARSAFALYRLAQAAAESGDYRRAIRTLFAAAVTLLDLRGAVHDDESATINELRRMLRDAQAEADGPFTQIARAYTQTAYADRQADRETWEAARGAYDRLMTALATT